MFSKRSTIYKAVCCAMIVLLVAAIVISCKKEHEQYSYTGIYSFSFADIANGKTGVAYINSDSSTIEVNWLYEWKSIDSIEPVITLPPGATIEPASGRRVAFKDGFTYTVTAQNGTSKVYSLKKIVKQPKPAFVFTVDSVTVRLGAITSATVLNVINDTLKSQLSLVNKRTSVSNPVRISAFTEQGFGFTIPATIDTGYYILRLQTGLYTIDAPVVYQVMLPVPVITSTNPTANIKPGDNITFTGRGYGEIAEVWCSTSFSGTYYRFPVLSQTATTITMQVPADAVTGAYVYARLISPGTGTNAISLSATGKKFTVIP
jgi:hypothetical protein